MRYTEPTIIRIGEAISTIQEQDQTGTSKPEGGKQDLSFAPCTPSAYQADE
jgi:hypothetical protein